VAGALLDEALALLGDGVAAVTIESVALEAGLPTGPLAILDAISLDVVDHALHGEHHAHGHGHDHAHTHDHGHAHSHDNGHLHDHGHTHSHGDGHVHGPGCGHDHTPTPAPIKLHTPGAHKHAHAPTSKRLQESAIYVVEKMAHGYKRAGRAGGAGFYDYESDDTPALWSGLRTFERRSRQLPADEVRDRLLFAATLAALKSTAPAADVAAVLGPVVPGDAAAARVDVSARGEEAFVARARELAGRFGHRFEPPANPLATSSHD
jgi:hypothetical protein